MTRLRLAAALAGSLLASACATPGSLNGISADRLTCQDEPGRPAGTGPEYVDANGNTRRAVTDTENGQYLLDLRASGQDCRENLNWVRDYTQGRK